MTTQTTQNIPDVSEPQWFIKLYNNIPALIFNTLAEEGKYPVYFLHKPFYLCCHFKGSLYLFTNDHSFLKHLCVPPLIEHLFHLSHCSSHFTNWSMSPFSLQISCSHLAASPIFYVITNLWIIFCTLISKLFMHVANNKETNTDPRVTLLLQMFM